MKSFDPLQMLTSIYTRTVVYLQINSDVRIALCILPAKKFEVTRFSNPDHSDRDQTF